MILSLNFCSSKAEKIDDDGFTHRLLIHAPPDECNEAEEIMAAETSTVKLHNLFLFMYLVHQVARRYTFTEDAEKILMTEFNKFQMLKKMCKRCDYGLL
jgi:hypothetical protein